MAIVFFVVGYISSFTPQFILHTIQNRVTLNKESNQSVSGGTKDVEIMVALKYLSNFWKNLEMLLIYCEFTLSANVL